MKQISILLLALLFLSGCLKDRLTYIIAGTYTVSGVMYYYYSPGVDSLNNYIFVTDTTYYNNVVVVIEKMDKESINVDIQLPGFTPDVKYYDEQLSSGNDYVFKQASESWSKETYTFNKTDWSAIKISFRPFLGNVATKTYILEGRKN